MGAPGLPCFRPCKGEDRISDCEDTITSESIPVLPAVAEEVIHRALPRVLATAVSGVFSLLLHGSVLAAAFYWVDQTPGAIFTPTEAVTIELLETEVLEAVTAASSLEAAASAASVQSAPGGTAESAASSTKPTSELQPVAPTEEIMARDPPVEASPPPQGVEALRGTLETDEQAGAAQPSKDPATQKTERPARETSSRKRPVKTAKLTEPTETRETASEARKKGAAQSRAAKGSAASKGRVSASTGSSINYAALVRARVAGRKPAGSGRRGTVVVAFGVTRSGGLAFASIARSSGNPGLDRSVLSAVRSAGPFPAPPPGAGLRFSMPFYFK